MNETQDAYVHPNDLRKLAKTYGRFWAFHNVPTTVALPGNRFAKSLHPFTHHLDEQSFTELLGEYREAGVPRPSGYADVFHDRFISPRVPYSVNALLAPAFAGGWQEARSIGFHRQRYYKYDMRSAYLWAATLGLPDTRTYTRSLQPWRGKYDGVYRVKLLEPAVGAPFPFNVAHECLATNLEIDTYGLRVGEVVDGVIWKRSTSADKLLDAMRAVSTWKLAARAYWGRWAQTTRVKCVTKANNWELPNVALNVPWAHLMVSRVKMRLWEHASNAVHVYVDSVITTDVLPTGYQLGDWKLEKVYDAGVIVKGPGHYGAPDSPQLERMAGVPKDSPRRCNSAAVA